MYLADSNLVINAFTYYPRDVFPSYWGTLEDQIKTGNLLFHEKVYAEILPRNDSKSQWLASMVAPTNCVKIDDNEVIAYKALTEWTREKRKKPFKEDAIRKFLKAADSWLVACGKARNFTLVSNEKSEPERVAEIKIPDAAKGVGVRCINSLDYLRELNVTF